jgi:hypothetical protein
MVVEETATSEKGRIVISKHPRKKTNVGPVSKKRKMIGMKPTTPNQFIQEMEGFIKEGFTVSKTNPLKLREIGEE